MTDLLTENCSVYTSSGEDLIRVGLRFLQQGIRLSPTLFLESIQLGPTTLTIFL